MKEAETQKNILTLGGKTDIREGTTVRVLIELISVSRQLLRTSMS